MRRSPPTAPALAAAAAALLVALALALGGCGDDPEAGASRPGASPSPAVSIVATTGIAADITRRVAGERAEVAQLVPDGASPHGYAPGAKQQQELIDSGLLVYFHPALEEALPIEAAERSFAIAEHVGELRPFDDDALVEGDEQHADEDEHGDDEHGPDSADPHVWLDPTAIASALPELAEALAEVDPEGAGDYRRRAARYAGELEQLDRELARILAPVPEERRKLVTSHEVMGYFAARYGFELVGAPFGLSPEAEASAGGVAGLIDAVADEGVPAVFAQRGDDPEVLRQIAAEAGVEVVDDLLVEGLGEEADTYVEMLRHTTRRIAEALSR